MKILPWKRRSDPASEPWPFAASLHRFRDELERLFSRFFGGEPWEEGAYRPAAVGTWVPEVDVVEGEREITVRAEVPGLEPEDIEVTVEGNSLRISGEKKEEKEERNAHYYRAERRYGSFERVIPLPSGAKPDDVSARYDKGLLSIRIGREEGAGRQRIPISPEKKKDEGEAA